MFEPDNYAEVSRIAADRLRDGANVDDVIHFMRESGFSVIDCVEVLYDSGRYSADEAKDIVFNSKAWADKREQHDTFHKELIRGIVDAMETTDNRPNSDGS